MNKQFLEIWMFVKTIKNRNEPRKYTTFQKIYFNFKFKSKLKGLEGEGEGVGIEYSHEGTGVTLCMQKSIRNLLF